MLQVVSVGTNNSRAHDHNLYEHYISNPVSEEIN